MNIVKNLENKIYEGENITIDEAFELANLNKEENIEQLFKAADRIREKLNGNRVDLCSIINAKSGKCPEDCKFCAQSIKYNTNVKVHGVIDIKNAVDLACENERWGINKVSLVTSGRALEGEEFDKIIEIYKCIKKESGINLCASLGILNYKQLLKLKEAGVTTYHHNLESSREYYEKICTTHSYDDRIKTIKNAQKADLKICSGGIIGLGESMEDRIKLALQIRNLKVKSIPINILTPIKGTPLEGQKLLSQYEILKTVAIFRFINPRASICLAGGRSIIEDFGKKCFKVGANATISGNYLTTLGNKIKDDIDMINDLGLKL